MTLVAGIVLPDGGIWMGSERVAGAFNHTALSHPKIYELELDTGTPIALGFAGSPRVAQTILSIELPSRDAAASYELWLTAFADQIRDACEARSLLVDAHDGDEAKMAADSEVLIGIEGHVVRIGEDLAWEEPARRWEAMGGAAYVWMGAYDALVNQCLEPIDAAKHAWRTAQRFHHIGDLFDEIHLPAFPA